MDEIFEEEWLLYGHLSKVIEKSNFFGTGIRSERNGRQVLYNSVV